MNKNTMQIINQMNNLTAQLAFDSELVAPLQRKIDAKASPVAIFDAIEDLSANLQERNADFESQSPIDHNLIDSYLDNANMWPIGIVMDYTDNAEYSQKLIRLEKKYHLSDSDFICIGKSPDQVRLPTHSEAKQAINYIALVISRADNPLAKQLHINKNML